MPNANRISKQFQTLSIIFAHRESATIITPGSRQSRRIRTGARLATIIGWAGATVDARESGAGGYRCWLSKTHPDNEW